MKTFEFQYEGQEAFENDLLSLTAILAGEPHSAILFHAFAECWQREEIRTIRSMIRDLIPEAQFVGTATFGNIYEGQLTRENIILTVMVFEEPDSWVKTFFCPLDSDNIAASLSGFLAEAQAAPTLKAVEAFVMAKVEDVTRCCEVLSALPEQVEFFGGKSRFDHSPVAPKFVINDDGECVDSAAALIMYGGENLHVMTDMIGGWNPLGRRMKATRYTGDILCELDGRPAHELYYKYLHIRNDDSFFFNTLEFPFLFYKDGKAVIRISHACLEDGSMVLGASIPENDYVRIAFGDSNEIMRSVLEGGRRLEAFQPEAILMHTCGCRHTYWGANDASRETLPFEELAPISGFYTAGELLRRDGIITEHNSTMVIAGMREGEIGKRPHRSFGMQESDISQEESLITRLSTFVAAAISELDEANRDLERLSITDGLTGLFNRREIENRIHAEISRGNQEDTENLYLFMMDLDDFKKINDTYGHAEGDLVLQAFSSDLKACAEACEGEAAVGRWGGEEFIVLLRSPDECAAGKLASQIRECFSAHAFSVSGKHTVSIGICHVHHGESPDAALSRADEAMYQAKMQGKDRIVEI